MYVHVANAPECLKPYKHLNEAAQQAHTSLFFTHSNDESRRHEIQESGFSRVLDSVSIGMWAHLRTTRIIMPEKTILQAAACCLEEVGV